VELDWLKVQLLESLDFKAFPGGLRQEFQKLALPFQHFMV
jgi:hypothetical protein